MCEQCLVNPVYFGEPLPGFFLARARRDGNDWKKGDWGLIQCNDPTFYWTQTPTSNPTFGMNDTELDKFMSYDLTDDQKARIYHSNISDEFYNAFYCDPQTGHDLVEAAKQVGYESRSFIPWLFDYLGYWIEKTEGETDKDPFPEREKFAPTDYSIYKN